MKIKVTAPNNTAMEAKVLLITEDGEEVSMDMAYQVDVRIKVRDINKAVIHAYIDDTDITAELSGLYFTTKIGRRTFRLVEEKWADTESFSDKGFERGILSSGALTSADNKA